MKNKISEILTNTLKVGWLSFDEETYVGGILEAAEKIYDLFPKWLPVDAKKWELGKEYAVRANEVYKYMAEYQGPDAWFDPIQGIYLNNVSLVYELPEWE